jgi:methanogenic corrinoid protein MtbC1
MNTWAPQNYVAPYLDDAVVGQRRSAIRIALDLFDHGATQENVIVGLLAAAQCEVGERWHRNELTVADEHIATGVTAAALDALVNEATPREGEGHTVVACAEGDWHSLAAQMFGESLHAHGVAVTVLGASTPADYVAELLVRRNADSLAISCSLPIFFPGVTRLVDVAHTHGIPVLVGGRSLGHDSRRALILGADAWAASAGEAADILHQWRLVRPSTAVEPTPADSSSMLLLNRADEVGVAAMSALVERFPPMAAYGEQQLARTREDLVFNVQFLGAALLVGDDSIYTEFLDWLQDLLVSRSVPPTALIAGLEVLRPRVAAFHPEAVRLMDIGHQQLLDRLG